MHFVSAAMRGLTDDASRRLLATAGIPEELLRASQARVPAQLFAALWMAVAREYDDEFFGLDSRRMKVGSFALLSRLALHSGSLEQAIKLMLRGFRTFLDDVSAELWLEEQQAVITLANRILDAEARRFADETFLVMVHGLMCWLVGRRIPLLSATFSHSRPAHAAEYAIMFCQELSFDAPSTEIRFDAKLLSSTVIQNERTLKTFLRGAPQSVFLKYKNDDGWTARVRRRLRKCIGQAEWPSLEDVARECHMGATTLRRRLDAEGISYQAIKDGLRRDAAIHHLCTTNLSVADIANLLGFQEPSAFHRAFKKWSGVQPGEYRSRRLDVESQR